MAGANNVPIRVFGSSKAYAEADDRLSGRIESIVRDRILPGREAPYYQVNVKVRRDSYDQPKYLIAYLLRSDIYTAEVVRIDLDSHLEPTTVTYDYDDTGDDEEEDEPPDVGQFDEEGLPIVTEIGWGWKEKDLDAYAVDFVVATPCKDIKTAVDAVDAIYDIAREAGLRTVKLIGEQATVAAYKKHLAGGLRGFVNIGHGNPNSIILVDGTLSHSWFAGVVGRPVAPAVVYFNSCRVFNDPLKASVLAAGARTFVGGIVKLLIGPSERVCECFWRTQLTSTVGMGPTSKTCEKEHYPNEGAHGIAGDIGPFDTAKMRLAHAMWVHGAGLHVENPERLSLERRQGFFARLRGKPFTSTWAHLGIPTPVIVDGKRLHAGSALLRFRTGPGACIGAVHIWDAEHPRIAAHGGLDLTSGPGFRLSRFEIPMCPPVKYGINVSVLLKFADEANLPPNKLLVDISAAGVDFVLPT